MRITTLGHAGLFIETRGVSILCDPWFNPAYYASWFPFPSNDHLATSRISTPTYLYISHTHEDHLDGAFLATGVSKDAIVVLPDYPLNKLESTLRRLGFHHFIHPKNLETVSLQGIRITIAAQVAPTDGPIGDSGIVIDDGETRIFNQNDSFPIDLDGLCAAGSFDAHFLQFSGAIWYPFTYEFPPAMLQALGRRKRENQMERAIRFIREFSAKHVFPSSGPPCFLDEPLFHQNDFERDPTNIFPDQSVFLEYIRSQGQRNGHLTIPGSVISVTPAACTVEHPMDDTLVGRIFSKKRQYLEAYRVRRQQGIAASLAALPRYQVAVLPALRDWFEPLLEEADVTCAGVNGVVVLDLGDEAIAVDFRSRRVMPWTEPDFDYYFRIPRPLVEDCVIRRADDWVNRIFLSCRFQARRKGPFNEHVFNFFKCLSRARLQYAEGYYAQRGSMDQFYESGGYRIQRRCPHLKADLARFGRVDGEVLTCLVHGWQFDLASGRCLSSSAGAIYSVPIEGGATIRRGCASGWYDPAKFPTRSN
jgi:UDP-MurNAc hydroxylase